MSIDSTPVLRILVADDDPDDQEIAREVIIQECPGAIISSVYTGSQLVDCILKKNVYALATDLLPHIVLLDINMPVKNGLDALAEIRQYRNTNQVDFYMFSTSEHKKDISKAMQLGVRGYYRKPSCMETYRHIIHEIVSSFFPGRHSVNPG